MVAERLTTYATLLLEDGSHWIGESPLHVALGRPAELDGDQLRQLINLLKVDLRDFGAVELNARDDIYLGSYRETRARLVGRSAELLYLHELVLAAQQEVEPLSMYDQPQFLPHIAYTSSGRGLNAHARRMVDAVTLLQRPDRSSWKRVSTIDLTSDI